MVGFVKATFQDEPVSGSAPWLAVLVSKWCRSRLVGLFLQDSLRNMHPVQGLIGRSETYIRSICMSNRSEAWQ